MFREISLKSLKRSPVKTGLLLFLMILITTFLILGASMYGNSIQLLKQADDAYTTLGILEYTGGAYPDETQVDQQVLQTLQSFPIQKVKTNQYVTGFQQEYIMLGYLPDKTLSRYFNLPYYNNSVITFKVMYEEENGGYRCVLIHSLYSAQDKEGTTFGLSKETSKTLKNRKLEVGHTYIGNGDFRREENLLVFCPIDNYGIEGKSDPSKQIQDFPVVDISAKKGYLENSQDMTYWKQIIEYYKVQNGSLPVMATDQLAYQKDFFLGSNRVQQGRVWTTEEEKNGEKVCLISKATATQQGKELGDLMTVSLHYSDDQTSYYNSFSSSTGFRQTDEFKIIGIYDTFQESACEYIFIPQNSVEQLPENQLHYEMGTVILENGTSQSYIQQTEGLMKNHFKLTVYDQGYQQTVEPILAMRRNSILIMVLCIISAISVIILFATLFVVKQQETVAIMTALGTGTSNIRKFLMNGAFTLSFLGCLCGTVIACMMSKKVIGLAYRLAIHNQKRDLRYSSIAMGIQKTFKGTITTSVPMALLIALLVFTATLAVCYFYSNWVMRATSNFGGQIRKKKKKEKGTKVPRVEAPKANFVYREVPLEERRYFFRNQGKFVAFHSLRNLVRNKGVSLVLFVVTMAIGLFMICYSRGITSYEQTLEADYENFKVDGSFTTLTGQPLNYDSVPTEIQNLMLDSDNVARVYTNASCKYEYLGQITQGEGHSQSVQKMKKKEAAEMEMPTTIFALERKFLRFFQDNDIVMTMDINRTEEFYQVGHPEVSYLEGYENIFQDSEDTGIKQDDDGESPLPLNILVNEQFLKQQNLKLGDEIAVVAIIPMESQFYYAHRMILGKIVGSYPSSYGEDTIYFPWRESGIQMFYGVSHYGRAYDNISTDYVNYRLKNLDQMKSLKDKLEKLGVSSVGNDSPVRISFLMEDKELVQAVNSTLNNISFMKTLRYVLFVLVFIIGFVVSYLTMRSRKAEIAIVRSMGTGKIRTFVLLFLEQFVIGLAGTAAACGIGALTLHGLTSGEWLMVVIFYSCYLTGSMICIGRMNQKNVLGILSSSE